MSAAKFHIKGTLKVEGRPFHIYGDVLESEVKTGDSLIIGKHEFKITRSRIFRFKAK